MFLEMDVGHRLRNIREIKGLTRKDVEVATDGEFKESILAMYESGRRNVSLPRLRRLSEFYEVSMAFLLGEVSTPAGDEESSINAMLMSDPDFSDEEKRILVYILGLLKAKKSFRR